MLLSTAVAQEREYGLKLGISNSKFDYFDKGKNIAIKGEYGQSICVSTYVQAYKRESTSLQVGIGYLERLSVMPVRTAINIGAGIDSITLYENWAIQSIVTNADVKLKIPIDEKFRMTPYIILGPQLNYNFQKSNNIEASVQKWKINLNAGMGIDYDFKKMYVFLEAQQMLDFNNNISTTNKIDLKQKSFFIALGIKYIIK